VNHMKQKTPEYQLKAYDAFREAIQHNRKRILIEFPVGMGKRDTMLQILQYICFELDHQRTLIITQTLAETEQFEELRKQFLQIDSSEVYHIHNASWFMKHDPEFDLNFYDFIFCDANITGGKLGEMLSKYNGILIGFGQLLRMGYSKVYAKDDFVFCYTVEDAVRDGLIPPQIAPELYGPAAEGFFARLLSQFGCRKLDSTKVRMRGSDATNGMTWVDMVFTYENRHIFVECRSYRNVYVNLSVLDLAISRLTKNTSSEFFDRNIHLLVVFGIVPDDYKEKALKEHVVVWDIANLLYYSQEDPALLHELASVSCFPLTGIAAKPSQGWMPMVAQPAASSFAGDLEAKGIELLDRLKNCPVGTKTAFSYEILCADIIRFLFSDAFLVMQSQHKTKDELFRMDLICSLKGEGVHYFWKLLERHYNTHFVVFEFKNSEKKLQQNLIYVTEKYLFDSALRNVAVMISRKGFSENAQTAAAGCLKENGKLILDITDEDLEKMIHDKIEGSDPTDYLLYRLENFLMSISK